MKLLKAALLLTIVLCLSTRTRADADLRRAVNKVTQDYFEIVRALAVNNSSLASEKSRTMAWDLKLIPVSSMTSTQHSSWFNYLSKLMLDNRGVTLGASIEEQKQSLSKLSVDFFDVLKLFNSNATSIYKQFCTEVGSYWLSKTAAINNPYARPGTKNYSCGVTKEVLKPGTK